MTARGAERLNLTIRRPFINSICRDICKQQVAIRMPYWSFCETETSCDALWYIGFHKIIKTSSRLGSSNLRNTCEYHKQQTQQEQISNLLEHEILLVSLTMMLSSRAAAGSTSLP